MKFLLFAGAYFLMVCAGAQEKNFTVYTITLPPELSYYDNQFSGLQVADGRLYLLSESRLQDNREAKVYAVNLADIDHYVRDTNYVLPYSKLHIYGLDSLADKMKENGQEYEGLEAFIIHNSTVYFSVETSTPSLYCYLLKGSIVNENVYLQPILLPVPKPRKPGGESIYNAGFEAVACIQDRLYAFYEYNWFDKNYAYSYDTSLHASAKDSLTFDQLPFRITDITAAGSNHFTAINFFYKGEGKDTVYRVPVTDKENDALTRTQNVYHDYCRLITIDYNNSHFSWKPLWTFPEEYTGYNWEGIAAYKNGYFILNDKYTKTKPYRSALIYIQ